MDAPLPIIVGVVLAIAVVVAAVITTDASAVRRARAEGSKAATALAARRLVSDTSFIGIGALLMAISLIVGLHFLSVEHAPRGELFRAGVGFAPAVRAKPNRGFVIGLGVRFRSCDKPVDVTVTIVGTAEYFADNARRLATRMPFTVALPGKGLRDVAIGFGSSGAGGYGDVLKPQRAKAENWLPGSLETQQPVEQLEVTSIRGTIARWSEHLASLVVTFKARWLRARGLGTCYLVLPPLVGDDSVVGAQDGRGLAVKPQEKPVGTDLFSNGSETLYVPYERSLFPTMGLSVVDVAGNDVLSSQPEANTVSAGSPAIACSSPPLDREPLGTPRADLVYGSAPITAYAMSTRVLSDRMSRFGLDCSALLTVAQADAGRQRDIVLLLVGALFSLGAAVLLEVVLDVHRRRFGGAVAGA